MKTITENSLLVAFFIFAAVLCQAPAASASDAGKLYQSARANAQSNKDFAFMQYRRIANDYPSSKYGREALFAVGEYNMLLPSYKEAAPAFEQFIRLYPQAKEKIFALAYLWQIANSKGDAVKQEALAKEIIATKQLGLIFKKSKDYKFRSPLGNRYKAIFEINKITIANEGKTIAEIDF